MRPLKNRIPWWLRMGAKIALTRLPVSYDFWKRHGIFVMGDMDNPQVAYNNLLGKARLAQVLETSPMPPKFKSSGREFNVLELGPGDSLFTVVIAKTLGATNTYLLDANAIATKDMAKYRQLNRFLRENKFTLPYKSIPKSLDSLMTKCGGIYLTEGKNSLQKIVSNSINFCFSNSVLQHIPKQEFSSMVEELFRVMKKRSFAVHSVDFTDLMSGSVDFDKPTSGSLNNLRFPERLWESQFFSRSGFYTNRLRLNDMLKALTAAGFTCRPLNTIYWPQLPIDRNKLAASFRGLSNDDLLVKHSHIVLQKT